MRKIFASIFLIFALLFFTLGFVALNLRLVLLNQDKLQGIIKQSNAAETASVYIEEKVIADNQLDLTSGDTLEKLNSVFGPDQIGVFLGDTVDRIFLAIREPIPANLKFTVTFPENGPDALTGFSFSKIVNLNGNLTIFILSHFNLITSSLLIIGAIFTLLMAACAGFDKGRYLKWLSGLFIPLGIILTFVVVTLNLILPKYTAVLADKINFVAEDKLKNGLASILGLIIQSQFWPYIVEIGIMIALIAIILFADRFYQKADNEIKFEAAPKKKVVSSKK